MLPEEVYCVNRSAHFYSVSLRSVGTKPASSVFNHVGALEGNNLEENNDFEEESYNNCFLSSSTPRYLEVLMGFSSIWISLLSDILFIPKFIKIKMQST